MFSRKKEEKESVVFNTVTDDHTAPDDAGEQVADAPVDAPPADNNPEDKS